MREEKSEHISAAKIATYGVIAAALISAIAAITVAIISSTHQKPNRSNANITTAFNGNDNVPVMNGNAPIPAGNNNRNSPTLPPGNYNRNLPPPPPPVPPSYEVDWGAIESYFAISGIRKEEASDLSGTLNFIVQAKASYNSFNHLPLFKAEFLDADGIRISPIGDTLVGYDPRPLSWDTDTRSRVSISIPKETRSRLRLIRFSRVT